VPDLVIQPKRGWIAIDWNELFRYRELLYFLVWRDVKVRYKQTVLGFAWALIQPLLQSIISFVIFGAAAGFQDKLPLGVPYFLWALAGQIAWQVFATALSMGGMSLVNQQHLLTKIYFPRLFLPTGVIGGSLVDLAISAAMFVCFMIYYHFSMGYTPPITIVFLPFLMLPIVIASLGVAYLLSAVTVTYRDFRFLIPFMGQIWMWVSFVMMPRELLLTHTRFIKYEWLLSLNPMYGLLQGIRRVVLPHMTWNPWHYVIGTLISCGMCVLGAFYFRKTERRFADIA